MSADEQASIQPIAPGAMLGVLGGGQLGRLFCHAAQSMGYFTTVLDADNESPAGLVSHQHIRAAYTDTAALTELAQCAAVTTEFENVPASSLAYLAALTEVSPPAAAVSVAQDRIAEKSHFQACGVAIAPYAVIDSETALANADATLFPAILKTARLGYDGKGQQVLASKAELQAAWQAVGRVACVLEKRVALDYEISVIVACNRQGDCVHLPVQRNVHRAGILFATEVYAAAVPEAIASQAISAAKAIAQELAYVGVLCLEFFVLQDGTLLVNEMAPRPHNSGHYSIDACDVSQFALQVRTLCNLALTQPRQHSAAIMLNLLGDIWLQHENPPPWHQLLALDGVHLHLYGKHEAKLGRKMGHLTITAAKAEVALSTAQTACAILGLEPL